jgi:branched-chain amino acid aminotransferase
VVTVSIDGVLVAPDEARISVFDRGLLYGDGCFEVLRTWDGVARDLDAHLDRLLDTARFLALNTVERGKLNETVYRTIAAAGLGEHRIRIVLTRGPGGLGQRFAELGPGRAIVIVEELPPQPSELTLATVDWPVPGGRGHGHKTLAYLDHLIARELARAASADEAVRLDPRGRVVEGATCNVFLVAAGIVVTPAVDQGALPGIVRARVLGLCAREGIITQQREVSLRELRGADELFVTSSLRGVVAVASLDHTLCSTGPITPRLAQAYAQAMRSATSG